MVTQEKVVQEQNQEYQFLKSLQKLSIRNAFLCHMPYLQNFSQHKIFKHKTYNNKKNVCVT